MNNNEMFAEITTVLQQIPIDFGGGCSLHKASVMAWLISEFNLKVTIDIGVYRGRSLFPQAIAHKHGSGGVVYGVDPWNALEAAENDNIELKEKIDEFVKATNFEEIFKSVDSLNNEFELKSHCILVRKTSSQASLWFDELNIRFDLIHIDGNHDTKKVMEDIDCYLPKLNTGGFIVLDDISWNSVESAYRLLQSKMRLLYKKIDQLNDFAVFCESSFKGLIFDDISQNLNSLKFTGANIKKSSLIVLDDIYPHLLSAFRIAEFNTYLSAYPDAKIHSTATAFPAVMEERTHDEVIKEYEIIYPQFKDRVIPFKTWRPLNAQLIYMIFINNAYYFLDKIEKEKIPFIFTLYPGGGFEINQLESDRKLRAVFASNLFRKVIVTMKKTYDYLLEKNFCGKEKIEFIYGAPLLSDQLCRNTFPKNYYQKNKSTFDICFVAFKYMKKGLDKGYDLFIEVVKKLVPHYPDIQFHVVGSFSQQDIEIPSSMKDIIHFHGMKNASFFPGFYRSMDIILSPNAPYLLGPGAFDGFPTGACVEAGLCGVAVFCTDILNMNIAFKDREEIVLISRNVDEIARLIINYYKSPEKLYVLSWKGQHAMKRIFNIDAQMLPRLKLISETIDLSDIINTIDSDHYNSLALENKNLKKSLKIRDALVAFQSDFFYDLRDIKKKKLYHRDTERLHLIRKSHAYEKAFQEMNPLVSVIIPTFNRAKIIIERTIPSVLNQDYKNWELIIIGDAMDEDNCRTLIKGITDKRIFFYNLKKRGQYPNRIGPLWYSAGTKPINFGLRLARGAWICHLDDDDEFLNYHISSLLNVAIQTRSEWVHGQTLFLSDTDHKIIIGNKQPALGRISRISSIYHASLKNFRYNRNAWQYHYPADWDLWERFLDMGVTHSHLPQIVSIHHGSVSTGLDHYANLTSNDLNDDMTFGENSLISQESIKFNICRDLPLGLSIVFSTRKIDPQFIDHIRNTVGVQDVQIIPYANSGNFSLTELYNRGLQESKYNFVVFIHDDIIFNNDHWGETLLKSFQNTNYGILGIAGTTDLIKDDHGNAEKWWAMDNRMIGRIKHEINGKIVDSVYSNFYDHPIQCVCLDGVFIAVDKNRIRKPFDERFKGFHYYDVSFVFANHLAGVKVGVVFDIDITHKSYGNPNEEWNKNRLVFSSIYENALPCGIKPEKTEYDTSTIRKFNTSHSLVSIIIPTKDKIDLLIDCLQSIIDHTHITRYEIIIADTGSTSENKQKLAEWIKNLNRKSNLSGIKVVEYDYYNFAKINNHVVRNHLAKKSSHLLFCNNDIKLLNDAVDRCLALFKEKKNIGTVGIRLHFADHSIQHNGIELFFGIGKPVDVTYRNIRSYYRYDRETVEVLGNTAAFLMMERPIFTKFYFNESYRECFEDVELNLQMLKLGRKNYQIGHAVAYHYESQTRSEDPGKIKKLMEDYWNNLLPFFKKHCIALFFAPLFEGASFASRNGQFQTAVEICEMLLEHAPQHADIHHLMGVVYGRGGDQARAVKHIRQAIALNGRMPSYHYNLAEALRRQGEWQQAEQSYQQALQIAPNMVDAWVNLALVLEQQGRFKDALACCQQALRYDPNDVSAHCGMGDLLRQLGAYDAAVDSYQRALQLQPNLAEVHHNLGVVFHASKRFDEAAQCLRQALQYRPDLIEIWRNLGTLLERQGEIEEARECYQQVLAGGEGHALLRLRVASFCPPAPASNAMIDAYREAVQMQLKEAHATMGGLQLHLQELHTSSFEPPLLLAYQGRDDRSIKEAWATLFQPLLPEVEPLSLTGRRPHIGFVVTRGHEGVFLKGMSGILNQVSAERFDWTVVCSQQNGETSLRLGIHNPAVRYLPLPERIDLSAELIRQGRFSVLYHWEVATDSTNYFLPFFRLAPVQCTGWGWPVTSGIPQMDYYLSSQFLETVDSDAHYSERLVRFQRLPVYFHRPETVEISVDRERFGIAASQHFYLCAQNLRKIHPDFDELIAGILRRDLHGVVALVEDTHPAVTAAVRQRLQARMPDVSERVRFLPRLAYEEYLGVLAAADVALDTLHFGGGITTYETLEMGIPIVTLPTAFSRGRYVYAAYRQMGLDEGIAADSEDYIERALRFAQNPDYRAMFRQQLREASGELFADQTAVREFEVFIETAVDEARRLRS